MGGGFEVPRLRAFILKNPPVVYKHFIGVRESERPSGAGETCQEPRDPAPVRTRGWIGVMLQRASVGSGAFCSLSCTFKEMEKVALLFLFFFLMLGGVLSQERPGFPDTDSQHFRLCEID